ncbi:MAG: phosphoglucosamine mutase, partial [Gallionellaceae bacterium]|nr:phosphoglucosamine mutase [Gallionellaceae bacterium]
AKVGDRYVLELMQEKGWLFGGENSGHIICLDRHTTGDGIIAALQVLAALRATNETLAEACVDLTLYPQKLINVRMPAGFDWAADGGIQSAVQAAEATLDGGGRVLLRPSGTEPLLRVMVEGREAAVVSGQAETIAGAVRQAFGE